MADLEPAPPATHEALIRVSRSFARSLAVPACLAQALLIGLAARFNAGGAQRSPVVREK